MDTPFKGEFEFLDLSNLDPRERDELNALLKHNAVSENIKVPWEAAENNYSAPQPPPPPPPPAHAPEEPKMWHQYEMEENMMKYETPAQASSSSVLVTVPQPIQYPQQMMAQMYPHPDWTPNMFLNSTISNDHPGVHPYIQSMSYPPNYYPANNDAQDISSMRDSSRRGRGRGNKNFNIRNVNHAGELQQGYMGDHGQFSLNVPYPPPPFFCINDPNVPTQQHPAAGQPFYLANAIYHSTASLPQQPHRVDYMPPTAIHHSPTNTKFNRPPPQNIIPQTNGETIKNTINKPYENKKVMPSIANALIKPSMQQIIQEDNNPPKNNIISSILINNRRIEEPIKNNDQHPPTPEDSNNKYDVKIENVPTKTDSLKSDEQNDDASTNINISDTNNCVEIKQNGNDKEIEEPQVVTQVETPKPVVNLQKEKEEVPEIKQVKEPQNETKVEEKVEVKETPAVETAPEKIEVPVSASPSKPVTKKSWASIVQVRKSSETQNDSSIKKPMAHVVPNNVTNTSNATTGNEQSAAVVEKTHSEQKNRRRSKPSSESDEVLSKSNEKPKPPPSENNQVHCDDPITYRMGEFLLSYKMDKQTVSLLPRGLTNRSNYCYINSILQALLACPPFYNLLVAMPFSKNPSKHSPSPLIDNMIKFAREFSPLPDGARLARNNRGQKRNEDAVIEIQSGVPFEPSYIYTMLKNSTNAVFSIEGRQEDAEEFLSCLLNGISDEMLELMKLATNNDQKSVESVEVVNYNQDSEEEWKVMGPKNKGSITRSTDFGRTPLSDLFRGQLRSRVCRASEHESTDYVQPFFTLQLDIEKAESVKTALEILVGKDQLEGMTCSKTKQQIEAWKQVTLEELPVVLILHLKWFDYKPDGCSKIFKSVEFPIDLKIDQKLMSSHAKPKLTSKQRQYKLFAVTYHDGKEATKGHYVTDAFHVGYGGWVRYDDSSLKGVSEANVLNPPPPRVPYLLYYRRCDTIGNSNQSNNVKTR